MPGVKVSEVVTPRPPGEPLQPFRFTHHAPGLRPAPLKPQPSYPRHPLAAILLAVVGVLAGKNCHTLPGDQAAWALPATHVAATASGPGRGLAHNLAATDLRTPSAPPPTPSPANWPHHRKNPDMTTDTSSAGGLPASFVPASS